MDILANEVRGSVSQNNVLLNSSISNNVLSLNSNLLSVAVTIFSFFSFSHWTSFGFSYYR